MYRLENQRSELLVFCEMIEAIVCLLLSCFAVLFLGGGGSSITISFTYCLLRISLLINPNIFSGFLINYLFFMILSVC